VRLKTQISVVLATRHGAILQLQEATRHGAMLQLQEATRPQQRILNGKSLTEGKYENRETAMMTNERRCSKQPANA
jgi:hypothetical protein